MYQKLSDSTIKRFWGYVDKRGDRDCWEWKAAKSASYGILASAHGKAPYKAHKLSWIIHYGNIEKGMEICHHCDNPSCVNPKHLFMGTHRDNMVDSWNKKRLGQKLPVMFGEDNHNSTLTLNQVSQMREDYKNGYTYDELSEKYNHSNITRIVRNKVYYDPNYKPINGNARPRPMRKILSAGQISDILKSNLPSRKIANELGVSKNVILKVRKGIY